MPKGAPRLLKDRYRLDRLLGRGGMGEVHAGVDLQLDRPVAVKLIQGHVLRQEGAEVRFFIEAKACARIDSHHVVSVYDYGVTDDGERFLVLEYVDGRSLRELLGAQGRLPPSVVRDVAVQICRGLQAAHDAGVVHRDLKPGNVMLTERDGVSRFVKVLDFGVAKILDGDEITRTGTLVGTADYMAPEVVKGEPIDGRADIYALGVLLYRLCTGTRLFPSSSSVPGYHNVYSDPEPPRARAPDADIPPNLEVIILRCLAKAPEDRFPTMTDVAQTLLDLDPEDTGEVIAASLETRTFAEPLAPTSITPQPVDPHPVATGVSAASTGAPPARRRGVGVGVAAGVVAVALLFVAAVGTWVWMQSSESDLAGVAPSPVAPPVASDSTPPPMPHTLEPGPAEATPAEAAPAKKAGQPAPVEPGPDDTAAPDAAEAANATASAEPASPPKTRRRRSRRRRPATPGATTDDDGEPDRFKRVHSSARRFERVHTTEDE